MPSRATSLKIRALTRPSATSGDSSTTFSTNSCTRDRARSVHDLYRNGEEVDESGRYFPDLVVREASRFIIENRDGPFFLFCAFNVPHYPEQSDPKFDSLYRDVPMPRRSYASMISTTDDRIGQVLDTLDVWGVRENTIILFMKR